MISKENRIVFEDMWEKIHSKALRTSRTSFGKIPYTTYNGKYDDMSNLPAAWTNGFWPALLLLIYSKTHEEQFLLAARKACDILDNALLDFFSLNHDVGFMWNISSGADYRLTGNEKQLNRLMLAAGYMMSRYNCEGEFLRAWNGENEVGWTIIDTMMNLPVLYRASEVTKDDRFKFVAIRHADKTMKYHVRDNGACRHIVEYDPSNGKYIKTHAGQGYNETSCWARGQSWGIYGFALSHRFTGKQEYIDTSMLIADYFIEHMNNRNGMVPCDFEQPESPAIYDSSAAACAACGMLELASFLESDKAEKYEKYAKEIVIKLFNDFFCHDASEDSMLRFGTEAYYRGIHKSLIYGDYFFTEAVLRILGHDTEFIW